MDPGEFRGEERIYGGRGGGGTQEGRENGKGRIRSGIQLREVWGVEERPTSVRQLCSELANLHHGFVPQSSLPAELSAAPSKRHRTHRLQQHHEVSKEQ